MTAQGRTEFLEALAKTLAGQYRFDQWVVRHAPWRDSFDVTLSDDVVDEAVSFTIDTRVLLGGDLEALAQVVARQFRRARAEVDARVLGEVATT